jgi:uncharacterized protein YjdB
VQRSGVSLVRRFSYITTAAAVFAALFLASCSGFFPAATEITAITLSPTGAYVLPTGSQQFTATATFGNNTTGDVTSQVTWLSSATNVATINSSGLATAVAVGSSTITAKSNNSSVTATAVLTVSTKVITAITVSPSSATISSELGQTQQFTAQATFSDGSFGDVTSTTAWTSSNTSYATISSSGLASPVAPGSVTIDASLDGIVGSASLTVQ